MKKEKRKKIILNSLKIILAIAILFVMLILLMQSNQENNKKEIQTEKEIEQQLTVPEGYIGIYTPDDLRNIANDLTANYIIMEDIDMAGEEWTPIGNASKQFSGTLDGNLHKVSNLNI